MKKEIEKFLSERYLEEKETSAQRLRAFFPELSRKTAYNYIKKFRANKENGIPLQNKRQRLIPQKKFAEFMIELLKNEGFRSSKDLYEKVLKINGISRSTFNAYFKEFRDKHKPNKKKYKRVIYKSKNKFIGFYTVKRQSENNQGKMKK
ncbi:hypothetical protein [Acinetobacter sp. BHS4]|uniref:hypothetical protein n=1 Tax=Acinetobacter sp. BHS4 TaxID=2836181 RepID=UPI001BCE9950|nr:hypothetical protein [Acinetobacter sp. BHS4]QVR68225.1 hypothetical protein KIP84_01115 [Acinetobacter sp. BHS4]